MADVKTEEIEALGEMADVRFGFGPAQPTWCEPLGQERLGLHGLCVRGTKDCHIIGVAYERVCGYCSRATGFSQPVQDEVMQGFVAGLRLGLHATYPAQGAHGSALASAPGRHSFASCDSAGCSAPPHLMLMAAACHQETSKPFPRWAQRAS